MRRLIMSRLIWIYAVWKKPIIITCDTERVKLVLGGGRHMQSANWKRLNKTSVFIKLVFIILCLLILLEFIWSFMLKKNSCCPFTCYTQLWKYGSLDTFYFFCIHCKHSLLIFVWTWSIYTIVTNVLPGAFVTQGNTNQSTDSTGGSIAFECRLRKWSWKGTFCNLSRPHADPDQTVQTLHCVPMSQSRFYR